MFTSKARLTRKNILIAAAAGAALLAVLIAALTGLFTSPATQTASPASPIPTTGLPTGIVQAGNLPAKVPNNPADRKNVHITQCAAAEGGWAAKGTAKNPTDKAITYTVTVFFTTDKATVLSAARTTVKVDPGKRAGWDITSKFTPTSNTLCVLRGVGNE
jgi:hypothetical protein